MHRDVNLTLPYIRRSNVNLGHHLNKFGRPVVPDALYQDLALKLSRFWRRRYLSVFLYHIWAWLAAILFHDAELFEQIVNTPLTEDSM